MSLAEQEFLVATDFPIQAKSDNQILSTALQAWQRLNTWIVNRQWTGYDPYDLKAQEKYRFLTSKFRPRFLRHIVNRILSRIERNDPVVLRRIWQISPQINANTMAVSARAYLAIAQTRYWNIDIQKNLDYCLNWLQENSARPIESGKLGWGYHFTWYAGHGEKTVLPPNTPLSVVTTEVGHAFLDRFLLFGDGIDLDFAAACGQLLLSELNQDIYDKNRLCFSYSVKDKFHVINANLNVAGFLTRLAQQIEDPRMLSIARKARRYSVSFQNGDGSWFYWGPPDYNSPAFYNIDGYHTGMVLQWLETCQHFDYLEEDDKALEKGLNFYIHRLFEEDGSPCMSPVSRYPQDVHLVAQALVTFSNLAARWSIAHEMLPKVLKWGLSQLQNPDGSFAYRIYSDRIDRTPYMRWGQGWMLWGLAAAICFLSSVEDKDT
jgi:hypothetical protein